MYAFIESGTLFTADWRLARNLFPRQIYKGNEMFLEWLHATKNKHPWTIAHTAWTTSSFLLFRSLIICGTLCVCAAGGLFWLWFYDWRLWARSRFCHCVYFSKIAVDKLKADSFQLRLNRARWKIWGLHWVRPPLCAVGETFFLLWRRPLKNLIVGCLKTLSAADVPV